jgi:nitrogen fixation NifU-like protein
VEEIYGDRIVEHFLNPRNVGEIPDADGVGVVGDPSCGDYLKVWIKVKDNRIVEAKFKCQGCPAAIATSSVMTEMALGKDLNEAAEISAEMIEEALGGLPEGKRHCSNLGADALYEAILSYIFQKGGDRRDQIRNCDSGENGLSTKKANQGSKWSKSDFR